MCVISLMLKNDIFYKSLQWPGQGLHDGGKCMTMTGASIRIRITTTQPPKQDIENCKKRILHQFVVLNFSFNRKIHFIQQGAFMPAPAILWPCHTIDRDIFWTPCSWQSCLMDDWQPGDKSNQFSNGPGSGPGRGPAPGTRAAEGGRGEGRRPHRRRAAALAVRREEALLNWRLVPRDG